jgi:hypothetical protein
MFKERHQMERILLKKDRVEKAEGPMIQSKILIDLFPLKDEEGFL